MQRFAKLWNIIIESITDGFFALDTDWNFIYVNDLAAELLGKKSAELVGKNIWKESPQVKGLFFQNKYLEAFNNKKSVSFEYFYEEKGWWYQVRLYPSNAGLAVYFNDITEQKHLEVTSKFAADASKILAASFDYEKTLGSVAKLATRTIADWCLVDLFDGFGKLQRVAIAYKDQKKASLVEGMIKNYPSDVSSNPGLARVLKKGQTEFYPVIGQGKDLEFYRQVGFNSVIIVPLLMHDKAVGVMSLVRIDPGPSFSELDLSMAEQLASLISLATENTELYKVVEEEKERLNNLVANVPGMVWEAWGQPDTLEQRIDFVNSNVERMLGYPVDEWLKTPNFWLSIVHPEDKERAGAEAAAIFESGKGGTSRFRWLKKDGSFIWVEAQSYVIKDKKGNSVGMRGVTMDISERMELERRKDEFISTASHELKTPVTSLKGYTQILKQYFSPSEKTDYFLGRMEMQVDRITTLVNDLLDVSRIQSGKLELQKEEFDLDSLVAELIEDAQHLTTKHKIEHKLESKLVVLADRYRIGQVIMNMLSNAIKYSPKADKVKVSTKVDGDWVEVCVEDFGIGISRQNQKKIFDRFYQASSHIRQSFSGLGLGLYISSEIVKKHNGEIEVESEKGKGSVFKFRLPLAVVKKKV